MQRPAKQTREHHRLHIIECAIRIGCLVVLRTNERTADGT